MITPAKGRRSALLRLGRHAALCAYLAGCASRTVAPPPDLPAALRAPSDQALVLAWRGAGVQVYECRAAQDGAAGFAWVLRGPQAELSDSSGKTVGRHYAGPTWEAQDGSAVTGEIIAQASAPGGDALPWLMLRAASNTGKGVFAKVRFIQRLHTVGGMAPGGTCDAKQLHKPVRAPYSADYFFYAARR